MNSAISPARKAYFRKNACAAYTKRLFCERRFLEKPYGDTGRSSRRYLVVVVVVVVVVDVVVDTVAVAVAVVATVAADGWLKILDSHKRLIL